MTSRSATLSRPRLELAAPTPALAGVGFRRVHEDAFVHGKARVGWVEVHSENYFSAGGVALDALFRVRANYPMSLHGVGLSLGSADPLDRVHLANLGRLIDRVQPMFVSEHLCWGAIGGRHTNDLLPMPYTRAALDHFVARLSEARDRLNREILIENISSYLEFAASDISEQEFLVAVARRSGCRLLLDVNNVYVNAHNFGFDPQRFIAAIPKDLVAEIHLAGHSRHNYEGRTILIDTHSDYVCAEVWSLYQFAIDRFGPTPTLIEWDSDIPALEVLEAEAQRAESLVAGFHG